MCKFIYSALMVILPAFMHHSWQFHLYQSFFWDGKEMSWFQQVLLAHQARPLIG